MIVRLEQANLVLAGRNVLHDINWQISTGQHWRIDGPNGAGKSTLLKVIAGLLWPVAAIPPARLYRFNHRTSHLLAGVKPNLGYASYTMQDEYVRGARNITVYEVLASGFEQLIMIYDSVSKSQHETIRKTSRRLGLDGLMERSFLSLSHGQKSAVLFARAVINQPKILVLDEIFNGVDNRHFNLMIDELLRYQSCDGQIVLSWHEHGIAQIEQLFTHSLVLEQGRIIYQGDFFPRMGARLVSMGNDEPDDEVQDTAEPLITMAGINVYLANKQILEQINWSIKDGERWLLKGDNGAGKTTLLKVLLAEVRPAVGGVIKRRGLNARSTVWQIRSLIGYVSPELQQSYRYNISVFDAVASGFYASIGLYNEVNRDQKKIVAELLQRLNLHDLDSRGIHQLSSGQMRRVMIARAMVHDPDILLFDEITSNLDSDSRETILMLISQLAETGKTMVFVGHHPGELSGLYNRELVLQNGRIVTG